MPAVGPARRRVERGSATMRLGRAGLLESGRGNEAGASATPPRREQPTSASALSRPRARPVGSRPPTKLPYRRVESGTETEYLEVPVDTIKLIAEQKHFFTAELRLADYGRVMLVGDQEAVEHVLAVLGQHDGHNLRILPPEPRDPTS